MLAYGRRGSGKTHDERMLPRPPARCARAPSAGAWRRGSFFEVYGGSATISQGRPCQALEDARGRVRVVNLREERVKCAADLVALVRRGESVRATGHTDARRARDRTRCSRCGSVKTRQANRAPADRRSRLLIDLAGRARRDRRPRRGRVHEEEGAERDKSLALKECIRALGGRAGINNAAKSTGDVANNSSRSADGAGRECLLRRAFTPTPLARRGQRWVTARALAGHSRRFSGTFVKHSDGAPRVPPGHGSAEHTLNTPGTPYGSRTASRARPWRPRWTS